MCYNEFMFKTCQTIALFLLILFVSLPIKAIELQFPVACEIMSNCWITNHVDLRGSSKQNEDYMCGQKVSNDNKSTHISLGSLSDLEKNHAIIAAADGVVRTAANIGGFCGYRVLIEHEKGWETSYCHLKPETLVVRSGQKVQKGQIIGAVGMSGQTPWPRLSFAVLRNGMIFDPFSGRTNIEGCTAKSVPLWHGGLNPPYEPAHVTSVGFTVGYPSNPQILYGMEAASEISSETKQIALWAMMMNILEGDDIHIQITNPKGEIFDETHIKSKTNKQYYPIYFSANRKNLLWDIGKYIGKITVTRNVHGNKITVGKFSTVTIR